MKDCTAPRRPVVLGLPPTGLADPEPILVLYVKLPMKYSEAGYQRTLQS